MPDTKIPNTKTHENTNDFHNFHKNQNNIANAQKIANDQIADKNNSKNSSRTNKKNNFSDMIYDKKNMEDMKDIIDWQEQLICELQKKNKELADNNEELVNTLKLLQADFENYKKRAEKENARYKELANTALIEKLLPVLDTFDIALSHAHAQAYEHLHAEQSASAGLRKEIRDQAGCINDPCCAEHTEIPERAADPQKSEMFRGIQLVRLQLNSVLEKEGLRKINSVGKKFDPYYHEVLMQESHPGLEEDLIIRELQPGYLFKNAVLRTSRICLNKPTGNSPANTKKDDNIKK